MKTKPLWELVWQEDTDGTAVPTLVLDVEALIVSAVRARQETIAETAIYPLRVDLSQTGRLTTFLGMTVTGNG